MWLIRSLEFRDFLGAQLKGDSGYGGFEMLHLGGADDGGGDGGTGEEPCECDLRGLHRARLRDAHGGVDDIPVGGMIVELVGEDAVAVVA